MREHRADDVQRQFQSIGFFGIDGHADAVCHRQLREFEHARHQFGAARARAWRLHSADAIADSLTEIDGASSTRAATAAPTDRDDRIAIGLLIARGIVRRQRAFAEHVEGESIRRIFLFCERSSASSIVRPMTN